MTYNEYMTIAETHYTKHCKERRHWESIARADYNTDDVSQRAQGFADAQFECMSTIEAMVNDAFPRKAQQSASRLLDINALIGRTWSPMPSHENHNNQRVDY